MIETPPLTQIEMSDKDIDFAERIAKRLGYSQTEYTSTSDLVGLFCLPDNRHMRAGCLVKTREFGMIFISDLEDLKLDDLDREQREQQKLINERRREKS